MYIIYSQSDVENRLDGNITTDESESIPLDIHDSTTDSGISGTCTTDGTENTQQTMLPFKPTRNSRMVDVKQELNGKHVQESKSGIFRLPTEPNDTGDGTERVNSNSHCNHNVPVFVQPDVSCCDKYRDAYAKACHYITKKTCLSRGDLREIAMCKYFFLLHIVKNVRWHDGELSIVQDNLGLKIINLK